MGNDIERTEVFMDFCFAHAWKPLVYAYSPVQDQVMYCWGEYSNNIIHQVQAELVLN